MTAPVSSATYRAAVNAFAVARLHLTVAEAMHADGLLPAADMERARGAWDDAGFTYRHAELLEVLRLDASSGAA